MIRSIRWDNQYMDIALCVSKWSKDPSTKVGAVVVGSHGEVKSTGYNGLARGIADTDERLNDRALKYKLIVHAEENAILNAARIGVSLMDSTIYISGLPPCVHCANAIIQAGIKTVIVKDQVVPERWMEECDEAAHLLEEAGVVREKIDGNKTIQ